MATTAATPKKKAKKTAYKNLNIPFSKELYESLVSVSKTENRSMTGQIIHILERELLKVKVSQ